MTPIDTPKSFCLYGLQRPGDESPRYIGITCQSLHLRLNGHLNPSRSPHKDAWVAKMRKEGLHPVLVPLVVGLSRVEACALEIAVIKALRDAGHPLVNTSDGGNGASPGSRLSDETKRKIGDANRGNKSFLGKHHSNETKRKIGDFHRGNKYALGCRRSDEFKRNIGDVQRGNKNCVGRVMSEETRRKIGDAQRGRVAWNKGKRWSDEAKRNMSEAAIKRYASQKGRYARS